MKKMNEKEKVEAMVNYGLFQVGKLYRWGGNGPQNYDCSGFLLSCLKNVGYIDPCVDINAQDIFRYLQSQDWIEKRCRGAVCFFGRNTKKITHIGIIVDDKNFLGANGGNSTTISDEIALRQNAKVDIRPIRRDIVSFLYPREINL